MFWTTAWQDRFHARHDAVLSSYTRHGYNVTVYCGVGDGSDARFRQIALKHSTVRFVEMTADFTASLADCPHATWLSSDDHKQGHYYYSHLTDYLRFCLLYKHGGIYSDFDAMLLRRLPEAPRGKLVVGKDEIGDGEVGCEWCLGGGRHYAAPGVMIAGSAGLAVLKEALQLGFAGNYDASKFGWCGPQALTKAVKQARGSVHLLPTHSLYPVNWSNAWRLFSGDSGTLWSRIVNTADTYSIHFYGSATRSLDIERGSIMERFVGEPVLMLRPYWDYEKGGGLEECLQIVSGDRVTLAVDHGTLNMAVLKEDGVCGMNERLKSVRLKSTTFTDSLTITIWEGNSTISSVKLAAINLEKAVTVVTKTFGRMSKALALVDSLLEMYPRHKFRVLVGDDGKSASHSYTKYQSSQSFEYVPFEYDIGLSAGRNRLLSMVNTEYALFLDDDFVLTRESDVGSLLASSVLDDVDIVGGKSPSDVSQFQFDYCGLMRLEEGKRTMTLTKGHHAITTLTGCRLVDFVPNLFVAKVAALRRVMWDPALKLGEHEDFFWRAKQLQLRVATLPSVSFRHMQTRFWENKTEYDRMRLRVFDFLKVALLKHQWRTLKAMGRTVMHLMDISGNPVQKVSVETVSPFELRLIITGDQPYKRYRVEYELDGWSKLEDIYDSNQFTIPDLLDDKPYRLSVFAGNWTHWSSSPATIQVSTPNLHDNLLVDGHFDSKWPCWKATIGTAFNFEPTVPWRQTGLLTGRSVGYALGISVIHGHLLPAYHRQHQFYHSVHQTVDMEGRKSCPNGGKLVFAGWSRPDRFSHADTPGAILGYRLQVSAQLADGRELIAVSTDFDHGKGYWQSRVATISVSKQDLIKSVTVRAVLDAMRAGAFFDDFYLALWCK